MGLGANAVVFVFDMGTHEIAQRVVCGFGRAGQHEIDRVENRMRASRELVRRASQSRSPMSPSSMLARWTSVERNFVGLGNRLFHQAFFQADAEVSVMILTMYLASSGEAVSSRARRSADLGAGPRAAAIWSNARFHV